MVGRRQKGKGRKRRKSWHRGRAEGLRWAQLALPDTHAGADPTSGAPIRLRSKGRDNRGDAC